VNRVASGFLVMAMGAIAAGCVALVPGAEQVRTTRNASDVAGCKAVGLGGNVVFLTTLFGDQGVAYRCA
jgi:hypothetical protein